MLLDMPTLLSGIDLMAKTYTPAELKTLRRREKPTSQMREKLVRNVLALATQFFEQHPSVTELPKLPGARELRMAARENEAGEIAETTSLT